jgi:hypothetical protein
MKDLVDKSRGMVILRMTETLAKIKPMDPLRLVKQSSRRKRTLYYSSGNSPDRALASRLGYKKNKRKKSS